jgi:hypothetical protein
VFTRDVLDELARAAMQTIHDLVVKTGIRAEKIPTLHTVEKQLLKEQISTLAAQLFGTEGQATYIEKLLQTQTNIPLAFLVNSDKRKKIAHFARPKPLFREEHVSDFLLFTSNLGQTLTKLKASSRYYYFLIQSREYVIASCWSGNTLSVATGAPLTPAQEVLNIAAKMCHHSSIESLVRLSDEFEVLNRSTLFPEGTILHEEGEIFPSVVGIFLSTLINNLNRFFRQLSRRNFNTFDVIAPTSDKKVIRLSIHRKNSSEDFSVGLVQYL